MYIIYKLFAFNIINIFIYIIAIIFQIFLKSDYSFEGLSEKSSYIYENHEYIILFYTFLNKFLFYPKKLILNIKFSNIYFTLCF